MLLPWAFPAAFGPFLFAYLRESTGGYTQALYLIAGMMTLAHDPAHHRLAPARP